jgi:hypothetical protein
MEPAITEFRDKKGMLVFLGILQLLLGALCTLIVILVITGIIINVVRDSNFQVKSAIPAIAMYICAAIWFVWMGIGSIMARRWARALILIVSWIWLIVGTTTLIYMLMIVMPSVINNMKQTGQVNGAVILGFRIGMIAALTFIYVIIPLVGIIGYSGKSIKLTCENRDPKTRWTDKCPLPVLAISLILVFTLFGLLSMGLNKWAMPFFGILLMGAKGAAVIIGLAILSVYTAWGIYKLKMTAWWLTVLMLIALAASTIITFMFTKVADYYKLIGYSEEQIKNIQNLNMPYLIYYCVGSVSVMLGYMFFILKYFKKEKPSEILPVVESKD